ncbi:MAG: type II toxin-antitoxin system RelE/ParE family toxin [Qipengyuania sp.]|jgi:toxin ParE1/3/4|nr:type II toxin-antitoxin system RelE/ParE family toxin [Qipengyuania sp.]
MGGPRATVRITAGAEADLHAIWRRRLAQRGAGGPDGAEALLDDLVARIEGLADHPAKGPVPPELESLGTRQYRQLAHPPFRIVYHLTGDVSGTVTVLVIADGRRDFRALLEERLLAGGE